MCLAIPKKIISISGNYAVAGFGNKTQKINCSLVENIKPGNYILSQNSYAVRKIAKQSAEKLLKLIKN